MQDLHRYHTSGRKKSKEEIMDSILANYKVKCKCGHTMIIIHKDKIPCSYCGNYVYRSERDKFKDKMRSALRG